MNCCTPVKYEQLDQSSHSFAQVDSALAINISEANVKSGN